MKNQVNSEVSPETLQALRDDAHNKRLLKQANKFFYSVGAVTLIKYDALQTWEDVCTAAAELRGQGDLVKWELGDLVLAECVITNGRPADDVGSARTVSALAAAIDEERSVLSNLANNAFFFTPEMRRQLPPQISWRRCAEARRQSGWQSGTEITSKQRKAAMSIIFRYADSAPVKANAPQTLPSTHLIQLIMRAERLRKQCHTESARRAVGRALTALHIALQEEKKNDQKGANNDRAHDGAGIALVH